ncbi:hypothetical protein AAMO2058_000119100 [Amorphochlora amoebiformis]
MSLDKIRLLFTTGRVQTDSGNDSKHRKFEAQTIIWKSVACGIRAFVLMMFLFVVLSFVSAMIHEKSKKYMSMRQQEQYANQLILPAYFDQAKHYLSQAPLGLKLRKMSSKESWEDAEHAERYFESQLPHYEKAIKEFKLHAHFANIELPSTVTFHDMIRARGEMLLKNLNEHGWQDFRIEKDKCAMFEFLKNNGLPHVSWMKVYREPEYQKLYKILPEMKELIIKQTEFPVFIKSCHITTGAAKSVKKISDKGAAIYHWDEIKTWARDMWEYKSNDWERVWAKPFNELCSRLSPGFMIQKPWKAGRGEYPEEIKIEVLWGRAYLAFVSTGSCGGDTIILRDGSVTRYTDSLVQNVLHQGVPDPCYQWIVDEGHLPRVWFMAEAAAKLMGIDAIRIDVFVLKGDPSASVINEDSLSSGAEYRWHFQSMAEIWAMGHQEKKYTLVNPGVDSFEWFRGKDYYTTQIAKCNRTLVADYSLCERAYAPL